MWVDELIYDPEMSSKWGRNYVGTLLSFKKSHLNSSFTKTSDMIDPLVERMWNSHLHDTPYKKDSFRVIQPTAPSVSRAIAKWAQDDNFAISLEMAHYVESLLPDLKEYPRLCEISSKPSVGLEEFKQAVNVWLDLMSMYEAPQRALNDPEVRFTSDTVAGPVFAANDIKQKGDGLVKVPNYSFSYSDRAHIVPALYSVSGKEELIKRAKWETGDIRSFVPMPLDAHLDGMYMFSGIHIQMAELAQNPRSPIGVGWRQQHGGFISEMKRRDQAPWNVDTDVAKWDAKFSKFFHWIECGWHMKVARRFNYKSLSPYTSARDSIYYNFRDMAFNYVYNPLDQSVLIFDVGQPSGTTKTSYSNSSGHAFIQCYHWVSRRMLLDPPGVRYNYSQMYQDVTFKVYGDDNGTSVWAHELVPFYTLDELDKTYRMFNLSIDMNKSYARRSVTPADGQPGMAWLGFRCGVDYFPIFDAEKALCSMLHPGKRLAPAQKVLKAVSLMVNVTFADRHVFDFIHDYAEEVMVTENVVVPSFTFSAYASIPTHEDCVRFWTGLEGSSNYWLECLPLENLHDL